MASKLWSPERDGISAADFILQCNILGFVAVATALRRSVKTIRRAHWRLVEAQRDVEQQLGGTVPRHILEAQ